MDLQGFMRILWNLYKFIYIYVYIYVCVCMYIYIYMRVYIYIYLDLFHGFRRIIWNDMDLCEFYGIDMDLYGCITWIYYMDLGE